LDRLVVGVVEERGSQPALGPIVAKAVLTTAIPTMPIVIVLAVQYQMSEARASSTLFFSVVGSIVTMGVSP
jgi:malonate transporter and related proteins